MTTQAAERLMHDGKKFYLHNRPLETYFKLGGANVPFMINTTMCWRGYVGTWTIENDQLQLIDIDGHIAEEPMRVIASRAFRHKLDYNDRSLCRVATIDAIFSGCDGPVFAHWYSGPIKAVDSESRSIELFAEVKRGQIISLRTSPVGDQP
jgi:hypothetical protein